MNTPKYVSGPLSSHRDSTQGFKNIVLTTQYNQPKILRGYSPYATPTKTYEKMISQYNTNHYKMARDNYERKSIFGAGSNQLKLDCDYKKMDCYSSAVPMSATQPLSQVLYPFKRASQASDSRLNTPVHATQVIKFKQYEPSTAARLQNSQIMVSSGLKQGQESRGKRSFSSSGKRNKYLTVVSRMPTSKKKDSIPY